MELMDAMAAFGPGWLIPWMYVLMAGGFIAPLLLLIWRDSRLLGVLGIIAGVLSAVGVDYLHRQFGYVKLLGLPHILFWTPLAILLYRRLRSGILPVWPQRIAAVMLAVIVISLVFDYADVARYILGERVALAPPPPQA
jgi:hypothetical protein